VIAQEALEITPGESEESLHERIKILERSLIVATIGSLLSKKVNGAS
jgi:phosphoribosylglycinamide formyltransferase-1